jgi:hypothetical protein
VDASASFVFTRGKVHRESEGVMHEMVITRRCWVDESSCAICQGSLEQSEAPRLCLADDLSPVCKSCGKQHAPELAALLDLARTADRVGQIGNYTLVPPLNSLLHLARVAEIYAGTRPHKKPGRNGGRDRARSLAG